MRQPTAFFVLVLGLGAIAVQNASAQAEAEIDKNSVSVHRVRRGDMPIRLMASGEIISLAPAEVTVTVPSGTVPSPQVGRRASVQVNPPEVMIGSVVDMDRATLLDSFKLAIRLKDPFPADATVGKKVGALIEAGELKNVVYFERPASAPRKYRDVALCVGTEWRVRQANNGSIRSPIGSVDSNRQRALAG